MPGPALDGRVRTPAPDDRPVALSVAGSDSGGGAGIQADLRAMAARGAVGTTVVTSVTAQHTRGVERSFVLPVEEVAAQYDAVVDDFDVGAAKTGMLATADVVETVTDRLARADFATVVDPVMVATSGDRLLEREAERAYEDLVAEATLVTPNYDEAAVLTGAEVTDAESAREAATELRAIGTDAALVTGGHGAGDAVVDVLATDDGISTLERPRVDTDATHGTGCVLSAAIAAELARGTDVSTAVERATEFVDRAVRYPLDVGQGPGAVNPLAALRNDAARDPTAERVRDVVDALVERDVSPLVAEVGMNVAGATPYAESPDECAAVEGRLSRTRSGVDSPGGVRFGASSHVARFLLSAREFDPSLRFAANVRYGAVRDAIGELDGPVATFDRGAEPADASSMDWGAAAAFDDADETPVAVSDEGAVGKEAMVRLLAPDADTLLSRIETLRRAVT